MKSIAIFGAALSLIGSAEALTLFGDDFTGDTLNPAWEVQRGYATMDDGWVSLHGSTPGTRDAFIQTAVGSDWSDYRLTTRFNPLGGGDDWYNSQILFRVQDSFGWGAGTYYRLWINTSSWPDPAGRNTVNFIKQVDGTWVTVTTYHLAPGVLTDSNNALDVLAVGGNFDVKINGKSAGHFHDEDPLLTGGIALGAVWESTTRYDYAYVNTVPEPESYALMLAGLGLLAFAFRSRKAA